MYFIQDYEPYFNLYGESYIMAQKSYEVGYHMVSLGKWNKHMIEKECVVNSELDFITFPYEGKEYFAKERNYLILIRIKKNLILLCTLKMLVKELRI